MKRISLMLAASFMLASCDSSTSSNTSSTGSSGTSSLSVGVDTAINVAAGETLKLQFVPRNSATYVIKTTGNTNITLELRDSTGERTLATDVQPDSVNGKITWTALSASPLVVLVYGATTATKGATILSITLTNGPDDYESDNTLHTASLLTPDSSLQKRTFTGGDVDWIKIPVVAGKYYQVYATGDYTVYLQAFASDSTALASYTYTTTGFIASTTGYVYVKAYFYSTTYTGAYTIRAWNDTVAYDKYENDNTRALAKLITTDSVAQSHYLQAGEQDWVKFHADSGKAYKITISGFSNGEFYVYADSTTSSYSTYGYTSASLKAAKSGTVFIDFTGYSSSYSGAYKIAVSVDTVGIDKYESDDTRALAKPITTDSVAQSHYLQAGEQDWLKFYADSGKAYKITIGGFSNGEFYVYADSTTSSYTTYGYTSSVVKATKSGNMFIDFTGYSSSYSGAYKIAVSVDSTDIDKYENDDTKATASLLSVDSAAQSHVLLPGDYDWIKFAGEVGKTYNVTFLTSASYTIYGYLYTSTSTTSYTNYSYTYSGTSGTLTVTPTVADTFYVKFNQSSSSSPAEAYTVKVTSK